MSDKFSDLNKYLKDLEGYKLPDYEDFPQIELYMEQVVSYICEALDTLYKGKDQIITSFMINNYVKAKIIEPPHKRKYNREHIGYLFAISLLKNVVSMKDIAVFIDLDKSFEKDKKKLYRYFKDIQEDCIKNEAHRINVRLDAINKSNKRKKKDSKSEEQDKLNYSYLALRLYIESLTAKLIADSIMNRLSEEVLPSNVLKDGKKERKFANKKAILEAKKLENR